jgi:AAA domain
MKARKIDIAGFRGFNERREIEFDDTLTLIAAHNSYGKTSITEAFEFLIYGQTSKVQSADSKDEYKGSYRNVHLPENENPKISLTMSDGDADTVYAVELRGNDIVRFVSGKEVESFPFAPLVDETVKPFILQHALKDLLLSTPAERFANFAKLLGFEALGDVQRELIAFCTKPNPPREVLLLQNKITALEDRTRRSGLTEIAKLMKKGSAPEVLFALIKKEASKHVPRTTKSDLLLPTLLSVRDEAVARIFGGSTKIPSESSEQALAFENEQRRILQLLSEEFIKRYLGLATTHAQQKVRQTYELLNLGTLSLADDESKCPLCLQPVDEPIRLHIAERHKELQAKETVFAESQKSADAISASLLDLKRSLAALAKSQTDRLASLAQLEPQLSNLQKLLESEPDRFSFVRNAVEEFATLTSDLEKSNDAFNKAYLSVTESIQASTESSATMDALVEAVTTSMKKIAQLREKANSTSGSLQEIDGIVRLKLDALAGTQDISLLVDLLQAETEFIKKATIDVITHSLKDLRTSAEQYVGKRMSESITGGFGTSVMSWYDKIKTSTDPKVHFSGFDLKKMPQGNRVQIKAKSYDKELVSAVSSLSESKLNALGLCMSIAINLQSPGPFEFIVIDDPIQSWDAEHEDQFIDVVRELIEIGKQVIILSHNTKWTERMRTGCEDLGGVYYQVSGYDDKGPHIQEKDWASVKDRLANVSGIVNNPSADSITLQQAEQEMRHVFNQIAAGLKKRMFDTKVSTKNLNAEGTRKILLECNVDLPFVNKIMQAFVTVDDAHHTPEDYTVHRQRIKQYEEYAKTLLDNLSKARRVAGSKP